MAFDSYRVYHYRPDVQPRDLDTLLANKLWASSIEHLNDPFEFSALQALHEYPDKQAEFRQAGVTCFCRSITNPLLWAHYARSHLGFAIGCDAAHPFFGGDKGLDHRFLHDIRYEDVPPSLNTCSLDELMMRAVITKPTCWAYEQEVRMIKQQANAAFEVPVDSIKEIIFGLKMSTARMNEIIHSVRATRINAKFAKMRAATQSYGVTPEWL